MTPKATANTNPQDFPTFITTLIESPQKDITQVEANISAADTYLRCHELDASNREAISRLRDWIIGIISPTDCWAEEAPYDSCKAFHLPQLDYFKSGVVTRSSSAEEVLRFINIKTHGLSLLSQLQFKSHLLEENPPSSSLIACLSSFANPEDPWTNSQSYNLANGILSHSLKNLTDKPKDFENLILQLLSTHIKPLFLKSAPPILTPAARKAISPLPDTTDFSSFTNSWKYHSPHIVTIFQWVLSHLTPSLISAHWPLIIPPLLTIIDDISIAYKIRGCHLLRLLLKVVPASLLERSGLGKIFHDTLIPYLLYLPQLTPEEESIPLLDATYDALIALSLARYPGCEKGGSKVKALDTIFRYGIIKGHAHAGENVRIAELLMKKCEDLVNTMRVYSVKHLKDILPMISATLTAPFALAYPPLLMAALGTLKAVICNAWPRAGCHRGDVLEGLVVCWCRIEDEERLSEEVSKVKEGIEVIVQAVVKMLGEDGDARRDLKILRDHDPRLGVLLTV
ncbi:MAG: hypothetical protein Q9218_003289 [Villophora microphyllina]